MEITVSLALALSLVVAPAYACPRIRGLTPKDISQADTIFVGRVVELAAASRSTRRATDQATTVTLDVERVVRGRQVSGSITVYGYDSTNSRFPRSVEELVGKKGSLVEVGIVFPDTIKSRTGCRYSDGVTGGGKTITAVSCEIDLPVTIPFANNAAIPLEYPTIIGQTCTAAYIRPLGEEQPPPVREEARRLVPTP